MAHETVPTSPVSLTVETLTYVLEVIKKFCLADHHKLVLSPGATSPLELLSGLQVVDEKGGVRGHRPLPLFSEVAGLYPGFSVVTSGLESGVLIFRPLPLAAASDNDVDCTMSHLQRALKVQARDLTMARLGVESAMKDAILASHDLIEGREPAPRAKPVLPILTGGQATMELILERENGMARRLRIEAEINRKRRARQLKSA